jgi:hypothetical protein
MTTPKHSRERGKARFARLDPRKRAKDDGVRCVDCALNSNGHLSAQETEGIETVYFLSYHASVEFEFDPEKSSANKAKHGIDFVEAQALWLDEALMEAPARTDDEPRFLVVGRISGRHWSA